jgi:hypothetical protein
MTRPVVLPGRGAFLGNLARSASACTMPGVFDL